MEDTFNKVKAKVRQQSNTLSCSRTALARAIDSNVISTTHRYQEVSKECAPLERNVVPSPEANKPTLAKAKLDAETRALGIEKVAGFGDAAWFSPTATNYCQPLIDLEVGRQAYMQMRMGMLDRQFLAGVVCRHMMLKRSGTDDWLFGFGALDGRLAVTWPSIRQPDGTFTIDASKRRVLHTILDPLEWQASHIEWLSPMNQAIRSELGKFAPIGGADTEVTLKDRNARSLVLELPFAGRPLCASVSALLVLWGCTHAAGRL